MLKSIDFYKKFGHPEDLKDMVVWDVPTELEIGFIPKKIYCNKALIEPLSRAFKCLIDTGRVDELKTWDGCWNFRPIRGYEKKYQALMKQGKKEEAIKYLSIHSWGGAIDLNASENGLGKEPKLSAEFVECFTKNDFTWGGNFKRKDGMHFQLSKI
jgi:hypothetical protein